MRALVESGDGIAAERIAALLLAADGAFFMADLSKGAIAVSRNIEIGLGHRAAEVGTRIEDWQDLIHPDDRAGAVESAGQAIADGLPLWVRDLRARRADGSYAPVAIRAAILRDGAGVATALVGALVDRSGPISDSAELHRRTEELIERSAQAREDEIRRRLVERAVDEVVWEWDIPTGAVTFSGTIVTVFGYRPEDVRETYDWYAERVHPDDRAGVRHSLAMHLADDLEEWIGTYRFRRADGSYVWVRDRGYLQRSEDGVPRRMVGAMAVLDEAPATSTVPPAVHVRLSPRQADVLQLVRSGYTNKQIAGRLGIGEQSVKDHVSRLLELFSAPNRAALVASADATELVREHHAGARTSSDERAPLYAVMRGPDHVVVSASPAVLALTPTRDPLGKPLRAAYPELAGQGVFELFDIVYRRGRPVHSDRHFGRFIREGSFAAVVVDLHLEPIRDPSGAVDGVLAYGADLSPRTRADADSTSGLRRQMDALETLPIGAVLTDASGAIVSINAEARRILGSAVADGRPTPAHAAEYRLRDALTGRDVAADETAVARALRGETVSQLEYVLRPPDRDADVVLRTSALPIHGTDGVVAVLLTFAEMEPRPAP